MIVSATKRSLWDRMLGAALLEAETYDEAAVVPALKGQALLVVIITSVAAGVGGLGGGLSGFLVGTFGGLVSWALYAIAVYWTAHKRFGVPRTADGWASTWRTLALASAPRVFLVFTFLPAIGILVGLAVHAWVLATTVFAVKPALDLDNRPALIVAAAGTATMLLVWSLFVLLIA